MGCKEPGTQTSVSEALVSTEARNASQSASGLLRPVSGNAHLPAAGSTTERIVRQYVRGSAGTTDERSRPNAAQSLQVLPYKCAWCSSCSKSSSIHIRINVVGPIPFFLARERTLAKVAGSSRMVSPWERFLANFASTVSNSSW
jgi:hypothetical protein